MLVNIDEAIKILNSGNVVSIPTETVYGMAAKINDESALKKIFAIKERPFFDPLIVHVNSIDMAKKYSLNWNEAAQSLAENFWPGPLTLILDKNSNISDLITSGLSRVGLRMPDHSITLELIDKLDTPLAAPSANKFKKTSPTAAAHVEDEFNGKVAILDGGRAEFGIESTVAGIFDDHVEIYRPGVITRDEIQACISIPVQYQESPVAPGQLKHHYMPEIPITISYIDIDIYQEKFEDHFIWKLEENPTFVARELYAKFRYAQKNNYKGILLLLNNEFKNNEKWAGVLNRISKAKTYEI